MPNKLRQEEFCPSNLIHYQQAGKIGVRNTVGFLPLLPKKLRPFGRDSAVAAQWIPRRNNKQRLDQLAKPRIWEEPTTPHFYDDEGKISNPSSTKRSVDFLRLSEMAIPRVPVPWVPPINIPPRAPLWPKIKKKMRKGGCPMPDTRERSFDIGMGASRRRFHPPPTNFESITSHEWIEVAGEVEDRGDRNIRKERKRKIKMNLSASEPDHFQSLVSASHGFDPEPYSKDKDLMKHITDDFNTPSDSSRKRCEALYTPVSRLESPSRGNVDTDGYDEDDFYDDMESSQEKSAARVPTQYEERHQEIAAQLCNEIVHMASASAVYVGDAVPSEPGTEPETVIDNLTSISPSPQEAVSRVETPPIINPLPNTRDHPSLTSNYPPPSHTEEFRCVQEHVCDDYDSKTGHHNVDEVLENTKNEDGDAHENNGPDRGGREEKIRLESTGKEDEEDEYEDDYDAESVSGDPGSPLSGRPHQISLISADTNHPSASSNAPVETDHNNDRGHGSSPTGARIDNQTSSVQAPAENGGADGTPASFLPPIQSARSGAPTTPIGPHSPAERTIGGECECSVGSLNGSSEDNFGELAANMDAMDELYVIVGEEDGELEDDIDTTAENSFAPEAGLTTDDDLTPWASLSSRPDSRLLQFQQANNPPE